MCKTLNFTTFTTMTVYEYTRFNMVSNQYVEAYHQLFSSYAKAKQALNEYHEDNKDLDNYQHKDEEIAESEKYTCYITWDGYWNNKVQEKITIRKRYVY